MAYHLAVANRKGGVGKSTTAVMLAHSLSVWASKRVLVIDLDSQCNTSLILLGGEGWLKAKKAATTISDYFYDYYDGSMPKARDYVVPAAGDIKSAKGGSPTISLLPGSLLLEDVQGELFVKQSAGNADPQTVGLQVRSRLERLIRRFDLDFDVVIMDCAPGLSFAALAALKTANKVIVPYRPDYVSQFAVDRVAMLIEQRRSMEEVAEIPFGHRRYLTLANCVQETPADRFMIDVIEGDHPALMARLPQKASISAAFEWRPIRRTIAEKYGDGVDDVRKLYEAIYRVMESQRVAAE